MIIKSLEIYGYGQFVQRKLNLIKTSLKFLVKMKRVNRRFKHLSIRYYLVFQLKSLKSKTRTTSR